MNRFILLMSCVMTGTFLLAQNDLDALRYSRGGIGGTSRFVAMGGAFGAVGADLSAAAYNPAGLGVFRKGEVSFSGGIRLTGNEATIHNRKTSVPDARFVFNNFGFSMAFKPARDPDSRHVIAFSNTQVFNFFNSTRMSGYTNSSSIAKDMLTLANEQGHPNDLNYNYEGLGFETFLLDTVDNRFISLLDTKRSVSQTRDLVTTGRMNDQNFSYAYSHKDKFYFGGSLGIPRITYESTTTHYEVDDKDSMQINFSQGSYTHTYKDSMPYLNSYYSSLGGFNSLTYTEYFKTTGTGFNVKLGGIMRVNDLVRVGLYYHTPTVYRLADVYYNELSVTFDQNKSTAETSANPVEGVGEFNYRVITPGRAGANVAVVLAKKAVIALDYEMVNYSRAQLGSTNISDFAAVNNLIKSKYTSGHNMRLGAEYNFQPLMVRAGYAMYGSPFGDVFSGEFVRHSISAGLGFRTGRSFYMDMAWVSFISEENYYPFTTLNTRASLNYSNTMISLTGGFKF